MLYFCTENERNLFSIENRPVGFYTECLLNGHGLEFSPLNEIKFVPLNVQTQCWAWIKLATDHFTTVLTKNLQNPRDLCPFKSTLD